MQKLKVGKEEEGQLHHQSMGNIIKWKGKGYEQLSAEAEDRSCWRRFISNALKESDTSRRQSGTLICHHQRTGSIGKVRLY